MNIIDVSRIVINGTFAGINALAYIKGLIDYPRYKKFLTSNCAMKDKYKGKRCFILGNGPSIKNLNIDLIKGETTFVVNGFYKSPIYDRIKPTFHCIYDKYIFDECRDDMQRIISENKYGTSFIFSRRAIGKLSDDKNCYYVYSNILPTTHNARYDLTKNANTWLNVIPFVIMCAIYMGFTEIILLGCDFSLFASRKQSHFYDQGASIDRQESLYQDLQGHAIVCCQHSYLKKYCDSHGIKIINATPGSLLDVYPQIELERLV